MIWLMFSAIQFILAYWQLKLFYTNKDYIPFWFYLLLFLVSIIPTIGIAIFLAMLIVNIMENNIKWSILEKFDETKILDKIFFIKH